jgi:membrane-bound metal-dependent hydrolase YbcI (DUF457 family)
MFVGHGLLAFAIVAWAATRQGLDRDRALAVGTLAAAFATIPDVDVLESLLAVVVQPVELTDIPEAFWRRSTVVHRTATHSLVTGALVAAAVAGWAAALVTVPTGRRWTLAGASIATVVILVACVWWDTGPGAAGVLAVAAGLALVTATVGVRWGLGVVPIGLAAAVGLLTHPFGDLFAGEPPPLLYPIAASPVPARLTLHPDPTLHVVGAFALELVTVWLAVLVAARLHGVSLRTRVCPRSLIGVGYAGAAVVLPPPTLDSAVVFVTTILGVGILAALARSRWRADPWIPVATGLAAVSIATVAYTVASIAV